MRNLELALLGMEGGSQRRILELWALEITYSSTSGAEGVSETGSGSEDSSIIGGSTTGSVLSPLGASSTVD